jgi:hypothetical protein
MCAVNRADRRAWRSARSLEDLGALVARWLEGDIATAPGYDGPPSAETAALVPVLAPANRAGFVTSGSQPGATGRWEQRAAVEGFASVRTALALTAAAQAAGLLVIAHDPARLPRWRIRYRSCMGVTRDNGQLVTRFGAQLSRRHLRDRWTGYGVCHPAAVDALCAAWQVTVVDPGWGRNDRLWAVLERSTAGHPAAAGSAASCVCPLPYCPGGKVPCVAAGRCMRAAGEGMTGGRRRRALPPGGAK